MKKRVQMTFDESTIEKADNAASALGMSRSAYVGFLINAVNEVTVNSTTTPVDVAKQLSDVKGKQ